MEVAQDLIILSRIIEAWNYRREAVKYIALSDAFKEIIAVFLSLFILYSQRYLNDDLEATFNTAYEKRFVPFLIQIKLRKIYKLYFSNVDIIFY